MLLQGKLTEISLVFQDRTTQDPARGVEQVGANAFRALHRFVTLWATTVEGMWRMDGMAHGQYGGKVAIYLCHGQMASNKGVYR